MTELTEHEVTRMLQDWSDGDRDAPARLLPFVYDELRRVADRYMKRERPDHTLQPTGLVHEAYVRLAEQKSVAFEDRVHFFGVAAKVMRRILVDYARRHNAEKRGGFRHKLSLDEVTPIPATSNVDIIALDEALESLAVFDKRKSRVVELRFFGGLSVEETAEVLGVSAPTVKNEWRLAKAWLRREISTPDAPVSESEV